MGSHILLSRVACEANTSTRNAEGKKGGGNTTREPTGLFETAHEAEEEENGVEGGKGMVVELLVEEVVTGTMVGLTSESRVGVDEIGAAVVVLVGVVDVVAVDEKEQDEDEENDEDEEDKAMEAEVVGTVTRVHNEVGEGGAAGVKKLLLVCDSDSRVRIERRRCDRLRDCDCGGEFSKEGNEQGRAREEDELKV